MTGPNGPWDASGAATDGDPLVPQSFSEWTAKIVDAFGRSWRPVILLQLLLSIPLLILEVLVTDAAGEDAIARYTSASGSGAAVKDLPAAVGFGFAYLAVALVLGAVVQLASFWIVVKQGAGAAASIRSAVRFGFSRAAPLIGWEIVVAVLIVVGLFLLIVPGVALAVILVPTVLGVVSVERAGVGRCFQLARGRWLALFGRCCAMLIVALAYNQIIAAILAGVFGSSAAIGAQIVSTILSLPLSVVIVNFMVVTYAETRNAQARCRASELSAALDA